jgi:hypothetical protein
MNKLMPLAFASGLVLGFALLQCGERAPMGSDKIDEVSTETPVDESGTTIGRVEPQLPEFNPSTDTDTSTDHGTDPEVTDPGDTGSDPNDDGDVDNDDVDDDDSDDDTSVDDDKDDEEGVETYVPRDCGGKTLLCHLPPGNQENRHELCLDGKAVEAHLEKHLDYLGGCQD